MKLALWIVYGIIAAQTVIAGTQPVAIGSVVGVQGAVQATAPGGTPHPLAIKDAVHALDRITTGPGARVQVLFNDDSLFSLGERSEVVLDDYSYDPAQREKNSFCMRIVRGLTRIVTGRITDINPERFKVQTGRATIGIRGCELGFDVQPDYDHIMVVRVPAGHMIVVQNNVPGRPAAFAELNVTRPMGIRIRENGRMSSEAIDNRVLRHLSAETTPDLKSTPAPNAGTEPPPESAPAAPSADSPPPPTSTSSELAQDVIPAAQATESDWIDTPPTQPPPPTPPAPPTPGGVFFKGGGLGAIYKPTTPEALQQLYYYRTTTGFISDSLTSVDFSNIIMDRNGVVLDTRTLSLRDLPLARFGSTTAYEGYRETAISPGVRLANDNLHQFVRRIDLTDPSARLTFWGYTSALYGTRPPLNQLLTYDIADVTYPDSRPATASGDVRVGQLRINTRTGSYAEYVGTTPLFFGRIEDLTFFGAFAQGVGFAGQNAAAQQAPAPDGVAFAGFRVAALDQPAATGTRTYLGYAAGWADPLPSIPMTRSLMSADVQTDAPAVNEQRVHISLDRDAYQNNVNTSITVGETPSSPALGDLHLGTPQSSGYVQGNDFVAHYQSANTSIELRTRDGGTDWVWGEWNGETVNAANGQNEDVQGAYAAGRTLTSTEFIGLVNGAVGYSLNTPTASPGHATAFINRYSGQARIDGTARLNVSIPGGGATALWSGTFVLGTPGATYLSAQVAPTPISANGHLTGMPTGGYVLNAGGNTYSASSFNTAQPQGFTGNLVGPGTGTRPVTGAIGTGQFSHTDGTTVTLTYGTNLEP